MFKKDHYLSDSTGRYKYETLYWYDGPQLWMRCEVARNELRLFVNLNDDSALSGVIDEITYHEMMANRVKLDDVWAHLTGYRRHVYADDDFDRGMKVSDYEAREAKPLGDAYLRP